MSKELKLCPFCGGHASYDRVGTNRQSCIVICEDCGCMVESNETGEYCGNKWNIRQESQAQSKALTVDIDFLLDFFSGISVMAPNGDEFILGSADAIELANALHNKIHSALPSETIYSNFDEWYAETFPTLKQHLIESEPTHIRMRIEADKDKYRLGFDAANSVRYKPKPLTKAVIDELLQPFCHDGDRLEAVSMIYDSLPSETAKDQQHTKCAICLEDKNTPLRRDEMDGYVCLTCIDKQLDKNMETIAAVQRQIDEWREAFKKIKNYKISPFQSDYDVMCNLKDIAMIALKKYPKA